MLQRERNVFNAKGKQMKKHIQKGFTLIELMIVVAIIGILAAVALPAYNDYAARARVSEAASVAQGFKTAFAEYYATYGSWPATLAAANMATVATTAVASVATTAGEGTVEVAMNNVNGIGASKYLSYDPTVGDGGITWDCTTSTSDTTNATNISSEHLPSACK